MGLVIAMIATCYAFSALGAVAIAIALFEYFGGKA